MERAIPIVVRLARAIPAHTIFTRFQPPVTPDAAQGAWQDYYRHWWMMTRSHLEPELTDLIPELAELTPPARLFDKATYSPWFQGGLANILRAEGVTTLVLSGGETDVCVMATGLGAIDLGFKVVVVKDALCSAIDLTHDASLTLMGTRFSAQVQLTTSEEFLNIQASLS